MTNVYRTEAYANDGTAPLSGPVVFDSYRGVGTPYGNGQWVKNWSDSREVFLGMWWATNSQFQGSFNQSNKVVFVRNPNAGSGDNSLFSWMGGQDQPKQLRWFMQGLCNNSHLANTFGMTYPTDGTGWFYPNLNGAASTMAAGSGWHKVELYMKASTTFTSRDGVIKWWVDGTACAHFTQVNICPGGFNEFQINHAWDGTHTAATHDLSRPWHHYFDQVYISTGGGGSTPPVLTPTIASITPTSGPVGTPLTIVGTNYEPIAGNNTVKVNGTSCLVLAATTTQINTAIPNTATTGNVTVQTSVDTATSPVPFTVTAPSSGGGTGGGTGGGAGTTTSVFNTDFSGTQGPRWYYLDQAGTQMTYSAGSQLWSGSQLYQGIWQGGCHPGTTGAAVLKYLVPGTGSVRITGNFSDLDTGGGDGVICTIKKNGSATVAGPYTITNGNTTGSDYDVSNTVTDGDYFTFEVGPGSNNVYDSTNLNPTVVYTPQPQTTETIVLSLSSVTAYENVTYSMTLTLTPTRATESIITLSSSNESALVPTTVTIPANTGTATVLVTTGIPGVATITATLGTATTTSTVTSVMAPIVDPGTTDPVISPTISVYTDFLTVYRLF